MKLSIFQFPINELIPDLFFNANTLLALSDDWQLLKERALTFLNDEKKARSDLKRIPDHEFLCGISR